MEEIIGLKELRQNINKYVAKVRDGKSIIVLRRSKVLFRVVPAEEEWESVVDFSTIKRGGVNIDDVLSRL
jgi:prevent-host-death family protein